MKELHRVDTDEEGTILYKDKRALIQADKKVVQINCTAITIKALKRLLFLHKAKFNDDNRIVLQYGVTENTEIGIK